MSIGSIGLSDHEKRGVLVVRPSEAMRMLAVGKTRLYELIQQGKIESYNDGTSRKIAVASLQQYVERKLAEAKAA